jgi:triacylglycerol lipase
MTNPIQIERDPTKDHFFKKIAIVFRTLFGVAIVAVSLAFSILPLAFAITAIILLSLALVILLVSDGARRFSKKAPILASLDYEIFSIFIAIGTYLKKEKDPEKSPQGKEPILLVHGYLHNESAWHLFKKRLKEKGVDNPLYTITLGHPFHSIEEYSQKVKARLKEIQEKTQCHSIKLIGHSMGGLVSADAAISTKSVNISEVITLGSPFEGTKLAPIATTFFCGRSQCAEEMKTGSKFLKELKERISKSSIEFTHYGSTGDMIVIPHTSSNPEGRGSQFSKSGHLFLLYSEQVVDELSKHIKSSNVKTASKK